jgi:hypothetical protein
MSQLKVNALVSYSGNTVTLGTSGDTINVASGVTFNTASATVTLPSTIKVDTIQNTNSSTLITQTNSTTITVGVSGQTVALPSQSISYAAISNAVDFRNIVINGDMQIAQRATSVSSITTSGYYTLDRWNPIITTMGTWTMSQDSDVPTGQGFANSLKMDCTTADASPAAGDRIYIRQNFEGQNLQYLKKGTANALPLTASFWVKSTKTGTFICELQDTDNTRNISKSYTVNTTNTWEFKTITFPGDTTGALTNDNGLSLTINWYLGAGTDWTSGALATSWESITSANRAVGQVNVADDTANDWYITGVQLEAGEQASGFEFMPIDVNLARCKRYFQNVGYGNMAVSLGSNSANMNHKFQPDMRTSPSLYAYTGVLGTTNALTDCFAVDYILSTAVGTISNAGVDGARSSSWSTNNAGSAGRILIWNNGSVYIQFSAEL